MAKNATSAKTITVTLRKSTIGFNKTQAKTVQGMGLRRLNHSVQIRGYTRDPGHDSQGAAPRRGTGVGRWI
jgi:hypothetical protein